MADQQVPNFEIPGQMRKFAEQSVEQAKQAFDGYISAAQKAVTAAGGHAATAQAGAKNIGEMAMGFAEKNISSSFDFAKKMVQAKDLQEVMRLQSEYVQKQMQTLGEQAKNLGATVKDMGSSAMKPPTST